MEKVQMINPKLMDPEKYDEHMIKESAETLLEAEEIKKDPVLMNKIKQHWDNSNKKINSLKKLKEVASNFSKSVNEDAE